MNTNEQKTIPVAIYTRAAATDAGRLAAQREVGETYIASRPDERLAVLPERYEDDGFSGNTVDRPGLRRLMADVAAGKIDRVVVERFDRLARDQALFAELAAFFRRHGVDVISNSVAETDNLLKTGEGK